MWLQYARNLGDWVPPHENDDFRDTLIESFRDWAKCFSIDRRAASDWLLEARNDMATLDVIVKKGLALTDQAGRTLAASIDGEVLRKLADEICPIDDEIRRAGKSCIWATQFTSFFETELEQAQDNDFIGLLRVWEYAYRELQSRIRLLNNEIDLAGKLINN
jgi:hypothetical protein